MYKNKLILLYWLDRWSWHAHDIVVCILVLLLFVERMLDTTAAMPNIMIILFRTGYVRSSPLIDSSYKPGNKNQKLGTLGYFEFVVDYASTISLDIVFKFHKEW